MDKNTVIINTYIIGENNENIKDKEYIFKLSDKIIDVKNKILKDTFKNNYNQLNMVNITEKIYKDYGKLFFDKGLLPSTINNYKLSEFTNEGRTFSFIVIGLTVEKDPNIVLSTCLNTNTKKDTKKSGDFLKKIIKNNRKNNDEFVLYDDEFPPL
jgi:hypothetical protein